MNGALADRLGISAVAAKLRKPTAIVGATVIFLNLIRMASTIVLTRMLDVEVFGVIGVLTSIIIVFGMLSDLGFFAFVVRSAQGSEPGFLDEIWTLRLIRSAVMSAIVAIGAWPIAHYIGQPQLAPAIAIFGLSFLLEGCTSLAFVTSVREQRIARVSTYDILSAAAQTLLTIALAWVLRSYWAIIYAVFLGNIVKIALSYLMFSNSMRRWRVSRARAAELWRFSRYIAGSSILTMVLTQSDKIVLSRFLPLDLFGLYVIAATLSQVPANFVRPYADRVLYPVYSRTAREDPGALRWQFYGIRRRVSLLYMAAAGGLVTMAPLVIEILYDPRYRGASLYLQILAIGAIPMMNTQAANQVLIAVGRLWAPMMSNVVRIIWLGSAGIAGYLTLGPIGLVIAVGTMEVLAQFYYWFMLGRAGLFSLRQEAMLIGAVIVGAALGHLVSTVALTFIK